MDVTKLIEKVVEGKEPNEVLSESRWDSVNTPASSSLNDSEMDMLDAMMLQADSERSIYDMIPKDPKKAADMAVKNYLKWAMADLKENVKFLEKFAVKEMQYRAKERKKNR